MRLIRLKHWLVGTLVFLSVPALSATSLPVVSAAKVEAATISTLHSASGYAAVLPPGVRMDPKIRPIAGLHATRSQKFHAILQVAQSKLGTPYRWGHNEDRGQYGFDCSNFTAYVYHHALGYKISGASRVQASRVGWRVPRSQMRPGDLLIFDGGRHVGIYIGRNRMIQEGGGLGRVGYLSVGPGTYWGRHITAVKRMYG
jgi:cell wall-associated NlpC family hydrolase